MAEKIERLESDLEGRDKVWYFSSPCILLLVC